MATRFGIRASFGALVACGLLCVADPGEEPRQTTGEGHALARLISLRVRVRPTGPAAAGTCIDLGPGDLEVRLRGKPIEDRSLIELERERPPTVHAMLVDTSGSMIGHLDFVRDAAARYVERLDPARDTGLVVTFDEDVILQQSLVAERDRLVEALRSTKMGTQTSILDALTYVLRELATRRERRVILLLTDGVDTASLNERHDVFDLVERQHDLRVFTIGLQLHEIVSSAPAGVNSMRSFLDRLAERTQGEFFHAPRPEQLEAVYDRIRELVESEAMLNVVDPEPESEAAKLTVRSTRKGCRIEVLGDRLAEEEPEEWVEPPWAELPRRVPLAFSESWKVHLVRAHHTVAPQCGGEDPELAADRERLAREAWFVTSGGDEISGCTLDVRMDTGLLYDPDYLTWYTQNGWIELETRPFRIELPALHALPEHPAAALDALAEHALSIADMSYETDPRKRPAEEHARPHVDYPALVSGRSLLEMRAGLARMAFLHPDYRQWALDRLQLEAVEGIAALLERYRRRLPGVPDEVLDEAVRLSEEGQALLREASRPSVESLERHLAAWLGDLGAHELFAAWESLHVERLIAGTDATGFRERWSELRRVFFAPSYSRVLALLAPVHDIASDRVGYYRVVLPRVAWLQPRLPGFRRHPEWAELPLDLVPDLPFGYLALQDAIADDDTLRTRLAAGRWRVEPARYELTGKQKQHTPVRAFARSRVTLTLWRSDVDGCGLEITADVGLDRGGREPISLAVRWRDLGDACR